MAGVYEPLTEDEAYLFAIFQDYSGIDIAEFCLIDEEFKENDGLVRAFDFQYPWWRDNSKHQIDAGSRSLGKSMSIRYRAVAFPFVVPGAEMVITAPENIHLQAICDKVETIFRNNRVPREMVATRGSQLVISKRPFNLNFKLGGRIMGRIPHYDGKGVKGCLVADEFILTRDDGYKRADELVVGDFVMTHRGNWKRVQQVIEDETLCYEVKGSGSFPIKVSWDHTFYGASNLSGPKQKRDFSELYFSDVEELVEHQFYWATPTEVPFVEVEHPNVDFDTDNADFWWLVGLYLADGFLSDQNGTRGRVNWVSHKDKAHTELLDKLFSLGFSPYIIERDHSSADIVQVCSAEWNRWLLKFFGKTSTTKEIPSFVFSMEESFRQSLLEGYLAGDGYWNSSKNRFEAGSASKKLAISVQLLAQTLGYQVTCTSVQPKVDEIRGVKLKKEPKTSWRIHISERGHAFKKDNLLLHKVKSVKSIGQQKIYNPIIEDDHSYVSGSIISHNLHPTWLEQDEAQDYPEAGWTELNSTIAKVPDAMWRAHGVTKGIGGTFDKHCKGDSIWKVHRLPAMYRPTWDEDERIESISKYGSEDSIDYRRNILGLPGDSSSALFVLNRLLASVDMDHSSEYNTDIYYMSKLDDALIEEVGDPLYLLDIPASHSKYKNFWIGMDVGWCVDSETEILTKRGWLKYDQLLIGDESLSINPETGKSEWHSITDIYQNTGLYKMVHMKGQTFDAMTTPHHRWLVQNESGNWRWKTTETLNTKDRIPYAVPRGDVAGEKKFSDDFVELIAWIFCEGSIRPYGFTELSQSHIKNPKNTQRIKGLFERLFGPMGNSAKDKTWYIKERFNKQDELTHYGDSITYFYICSNLAKQFGINDIFLNKWKEISPDFLVHLTQGQLDLFLEVCNLADGWTNKHNRYCFEQNSFERIKSYEMACALAGRAFSTSFSEGRERWHTGLLKSSTVAPVSAASNKTLVSSQGMSITSDVKFRTIWCPTIRHGNWLARRNGSIYFTGNTTSPSSICVFAEERDHKQERTSLRLITRILLTRVSGPDQVAIVSHLLDLYRPLAFGMDATGAGHPLVQFLQEEAKANDSLRPLLERIKGYTFSANIVVGFNDTVEIDENDPNGWKEAQIVRNVKDYSSDCLRELVDQKRLILPNDMDLIKEFQGETWSFSKSMIDHYGRRKVYSGTGAHSLDASRMAALAYKQNAVEQFIKNHEEAHSELPPVIFL